VIPQAAFNVVWIAPILTAFVIPITTAITFATILAGISIFRIVAIEDGTTATADASVIVWTKLVRVYPADFTNRTAESTTPWIMAMVGLDRQRGDMRGRLKPTNGKGGNARFRRSADTA